MMRTVIMLAGVAVCAAVVAPRLFDEQDERPLSAARLTEDDSVTNPTLATVTLRSRNNHYQADATINGASLPVLVDTGASVVALTYEDARRMGLIAPGDHWDMKVQTANGVARAKRVTLDSVRIGGIVIRNVAAVVADKDAMTSNLLGMSFLSRLGRFEVRDGRMIMEQ